MYYYGYILCIPIIVGSYSCTYKMVPILGETLLTTQCGVSLDCHSNVLQRFRKTLHLVLSCVEAKKTMQSLLRDVAWCCKEVPFHQK